MNTRPETYQKQDSEPLKGMANFARWWSPKARSLSPSDIDAWLHSRTGDRHLFIEFKTQNEDLSKMGGQLEGLTSLTRRDGIQVLIVFDPYWNDPSSAPMDREAPLRVVVIRNGRVQPEQVTTLGRFSDCVWDWNWDKGPLAS